MYLIRIKDKTFDKFKLFKTEVDNQKDNKIKMVQSDRGGEYFLNDFDAFCEEHGIIHQKTTLFTTQQNGMTERKNTISMDMINYMLLNAKLPNMG